MTRHTGMPGAEVRARIAEARNRPPQQAREAVEALVRRQFAEVAGAVLTTGTVSTRQLEDATRVILAAFDACTKEA